MFLKPSLRVGFTPQKLGCRPGSDVARFQFRLVTGPAPASSHTHNTIPPAFIPALPFLFPSSDTAITTTTTRVRPLPAQKIDELR